MNWYVERFRQAVNKGNFDQEQARVGRVALSAGRVAAAQLINYQVVGVGDKRSGVLERPTFTGQRLWVARTIGATVAGRPAEMAIISSEYEKDKLYQGLTFGREDDKQPFIRLRTLLPPAPGDDQNQYEQALLWARKPASHPEIHSQLVLPEHVVAELNEAMPRPAAKAK